MISLIVYNSIALIAGAVYDITSDDEHQNDAMPDTEESSQKHEDDTNDVEHDERKT